MQPVAAAARALADPTRLRIAAALLSGEELCVCDVSWIVDHAKNLVSHHLRQLKTAGLVTSRRDGKLVMYRLVDRGGELVNALLGTSPRNGDRRPHILGGLKRGRGVLRCPADRGDHPTARARHHGSRGSRRRNGRVRG